MKLKVLIASIFVLVQLAGAQRYKITDLGSLQPVAINTLGEVVGNLNSDAYVWIKGDGMHNLGLLPGGTFAIAAGINDLGQVSGSADSAAILFDSADVTKTAKCTSQVQPFLWKPGRGLTTAAELPVGAGLWKDGYPLREPACSWPFYATGINNQSAVVASNFGDRDSYAFGYLWIGSQGITYVGSGFEIDTNGINNLGVIVGNSREFNNRSNPYLQKNGVVTTLAGLGASSSLCSGANSVNDLSLVVGWAELTAMTNCFAGPIHAVLWESSVIKDLGTLPGDTSSAALRSNTAGTVIGTSGSSVLSDPVLSYKIQVVGRPFVWTKHSGMKDLNSMIIARGGWTLNTVADINSSGQIVGTGTLEGKTHGFLLTPAM